MGGGGQDTPDSPRRRRPYMEHRRLSRYFPNYSIKRLLVDAGGRGRCHVVKPTRIVRYLADHLTANCSTSRFYNYAFAIFLCCIVCATMILLESNRAAKLSFPCSHLMKKMQLQAYFRFISSCTEATCGSGWCTALEHFGICTF